MGALQDWDHEDAPGAPATSQELGLILALKGDWRAELRTAPLLRIPVEPAAGNGLRKKSQIVVDKAQTVFRDKV